ncbi:Guanine nucleotide-binding protein subunit gamma [Tieghemiomyces parasiticus]|uniref:Guanine nucleotide-binding protein subunit gamma n=1 Tax=Tieghemiomyces parasiticus TaxID=78921 RepID=A0A9W8AA11_9FUNG|nr:Guanine nucleotide-binding protein subunit gamma [Tieghemiomyces parasiticus]KAJ1926733.1 Guanine nucleotide-binding protein subunit gamma [Tieghemiomyces parasiticus]
MSDVRYQKLLRQNEALRELLDLPRLAVSEASRSLIEFTTQTSDPLVPSVWGQPASDPFAVSSGSCCGFL